jgi:signal transduction histidine kinase
LNQALNQIESFGENENFDIVLAQITDVWDGVCEIRFEISDEMRIELRASSSVAVCVLEVIREATSNAIKHGGATEILVSVKPTSRDSLLLVEILNNGKLPDAESEAGYGSQLLSEVTYSWSIGEKNGRTLVRAKLAR